MSMHWWCTGWCVYKSIKSCIYQCMNALIYLCINECIGPSMCICVIIVTWVYLYDYINTSIGKYMHPLLYYLLIDAYLHWYIYILIDASVYHGLVDVYRHQCNIIDEYRIHWAIFNSINVYPLIYWSLVFIVNFVRK